MLTGALDLFFPILVHVAFMTNDVWMHDFLKAESHVVPARLVTDHVYDFAGEGGDTLTRSSG